HHGDARQRLEIVDGIDLQLAVQVGVDGVRADRAHEQRVAVGLGAGGHLHADVAAGAVAVLDDDAFTELAAQVLADDSGQDVGGAAGGEGHDDGDRLGGEVLGHGRRGGQGADTGEGDGAGKGD